MVKTKAPGHLTAAGLFVAVFLLLAGAGLGQPARADDSSWRKPLSSRNQFPLALLFLGFEPERGLSLEAGRTALSIDLSYSNILKLSSFEEDRLSLDMEWLRALAQFEVGLGHGIQWGISVPLYFQSGGFLDPFISDFHETFGIPNSVRRREPNNRFLFELHQGGTSVWNRTQGGWSLGDLVMSLKKAWNVSGAEIGLRAAVKAPTGRWDRGAGSDAFDVGLGFLAGRTGPRWGWFFNANYVFLGNPPSGGLSPRDHFSAVAGLDLAASRRLAFVAQLEYREPFLRSRVPILLQSTAQLALGVRWRASERSVLEFRLTEDLASASPDFTFGFRLELLSRRPGSGPVR